MKNITLLLILSIMTLGISSTKLWGAGSQATDDGAVPESLTWLVLSPIPVSETGGSAQPDETVQKKAFTDDLLASQGGENRIQPKPGNKVSVNGVEREWKVAQTVDDQISLASTDGKNDFKIAYASAEFDVPKDAKAWLGIGSDDGVRIWLNGELVHENWSIRAVHVDEDVVPVALKAGRNRLLIKVQNVKGGWGFACRLMSAEARADRLVAVAGEGNLAATTSLVDKGFDLNGRTREGLTPYQAARLWGHADVVNYLSKQGADSKAAPPAPALLVDSLIVRRFSKDGAGVAVLVARDGKILYEKVYGLANVEKHEPVTIDTKFRIGSVTKQFTASAILRLQESGKLTVSDTLSKYYPDFPRGSEVTLRHLLTHTSGIHSYTETPGFLKNVTSATTTADVISSIKTFPYDFNPGLKWSYCNSGYYILGSIVEKVSGREYGAFLNETFFAPFQMTNTGVYRNDKPPSGAAVGYEYEGGHFKKTLDWDMSWAGGAGTIYSTVKDLYLWNEAIFTGQVLSKEDLAAAFTPVITEENKSDNLVDGYGYGWGISHFRGVREISHNGGLHGFLSSLIRLPEQNFTVVVLINASPAKPGTDPGALAHEIAEMYLGFELAARPVRSTKAGENISHDALAAIVGRYDYGSANLVVTLDGDHVYAQLGGQPRFEIFPKSDTEFFWKVVDAQVAFVKDPTGKVVSATHQQGGMTIHAARLAEVAEIKLDDTQTEPLLGDYEFNPVGKLTISRENKRLYGQITGQPKIELFASSETEWFLRAVNAKLSFVKGADGAVVKAILRQRGQTYEMPKLLQQ
jgi:CubicO group peptidase (beta-lactamase class C family)